MVEKPSLPSPFPIAVHFLLAGFGFAAAWVVREMAVPGFEMLLVFAILLALGGAIRLTKGLFGLAKFALEHRKWARYQAQGANPKADHLAGTADLKRRGLIR